MRPGRIGESHPEVLSVYVLTHVYAYAPGYVCKGGFLPLQVETFIDPQKDKRLICLSRPGKASWRLHVTPRLTTFLHTPASLLRRASVTPSSHAAATRFETSPQRHAAAQPYVSAAQRAAKERASLICGRAGGRRNGVSRWARPGCIHTYVD